MRSPRDCQHAHLTAADIGLPVADVSAELAQSPITGMSTDPTSCPAGSGALGIQFPGAAADGDDDVDAEEEEADNDSDDDGGGGDDEEEEDDDEEEEEDPEDTRRVGRWLSSTGGASRSCDAALTATRLPGGNGRACGCPPNAKGRNPQQSGQYKTYYSGRGTCNMYALGAGCKPEPFVQPRWYQTWKGVKICSEQASVIPAPHHRPMARRLLVFVQVKVLIIVVLLPLLLAHLPPSDHPCRAPSTGGPFADGFTARAGAGPVPRQLPAMRDHLRVGRLLLTGSAGLPPQPDSGGAKLAILGHGAGERTFISMEPARKGVALLVAR
jgi:hypothetical protein